jgi:hypothetical protein
MAQKIFDIHENNIRWAVSNGIRPASMIVTQPRVVPVMSTRNDPAPVSTPGPEPVLTQPVENIAFMNTSMIPSRADQILEMTQWRSSAPVVSAPPPAFVQAPANHRHRAISRPFVPSAAALARTRGISAPAKAQALMLDSLHRRSSSGDKEARNIDMSLPDYLNTAVWIEKIPTAASHRDILRAVRNCGKIFCLVVAAPDANHGTQAAKLVFTTSDAAQRFLLQSNSGRGVSILGGRIIVRPNRVKYRAHDSSTQTRILRIQGKEEDITFARFETKFRENFEFTLEDWRFLPSYEKGRRIIELSFTRIDCGSEWAYWIVAGDQEFKTLYEVIYGPDPCEGPNEDLATGMEGLTLQTAGV